MGSTSFTTDGQLWIGSTAVPHTVVGSLTSLDSSVTITNGSGTIDLSTSASGGGLSSLKNNPEWFDDFVWGDIVYPGELSWTQVGGGFSPGSPQDNHPGIITGLQTTPGFIGVSSFAQNYLTDGIFSFECVIQIPVLSTSDDNFEVHIGFMDAPGIPVANEVSFIYNNTLNSGHWTCVSVLAGGTATVDTGVSVDTDWHNLKIVCDTLTGIDYYIDGVLVANIVAGNTPTSPVYWFFYLEKLVDTNSVDSILSVDAFYGKIALTNNRFY